MCRMQEQLGQQCLQWLEDQVYSIREAATQNLQQLAQEFGSDWAKEHLVPQVANPLHLRRCQGSHSRAVSSF
jgi:serine/threonine-protein phosphatase 2A regulatory subunit A